jgi:hypothetical protein
MNEPVDSIMRLLSADDRKRMLRRLVDDAFADCGFDRRLVNALIAFGYTDPAQLLPLSSRELTYIINVGPKGRAAIEAWRQRAKAVPGIRT